MSLRPMKPIPNLKSINQKSKILCRHTVQNKDGEQNVVIQLLGKRDVKKFVKVLKKCQSNGNYTNHFMGEFLNPIVLGYLQKGELEPTEWNTIVIDQKGKTIWVGTDVLNQISEKEYQSKISSNVPTYEIPIGY